MSIIKSRDLGQDFLYSMLHIIFAGGGRGGVGVLKACSKWNAVILSEKDPPKKGRSPFYCGPMYVFSFFPFTIFSPCQNIHFKVKSYSAFQLVFLNTCIQYILFNIIQILYIVYILDIHTINICIHKKDSLEDSHRLQ